MKKVKNPKPQKGLKITHLDELPKVTAFEPNSEPNPKNTITIRFKPFGEPTKIKNPLD